MHLKTWGKGPTFPQYREGHCWYCCDEKATHTVPLYFHKVKDRTRTASYPLVEVTYVTESVAIPRCDSCAALHKRDDRLTTRAGVILGVGGFLFVAIFFGVPFATRGDLNASPSGILMVLAFSPFFLSLPFAGYYLQRGRDYVARGIRRADMIKEFPKVKELLSSGYVSGKRPTM